MNDLVELENIHLEISPPGERSLSGIFHARGKHQYYHYKCDGFDDSGWGCGYRTTQTICSWLRQQLLAESSSSKVRDVPTLLEIQRILAESGDKPSSFVGSREWIGCVEAAIVIDTLYEVPCRIVHCDSGAGLNEKIELIREHFESFAAPIMMGGDVDTASKGVLALAQTTQRNSFLLTADPHLKKNEQIKIDKDFLLSNNWISWRNIDSFEKTSFYNFCMPLKKPLSLNS